MKLTREGFCGMSPEQLDRWRATAKRERRKRVAADHATGLKKCVRCDQTKELLNFKKDTGYRDGYCSVCRTCKGDPCRTRKSRSDGTSSRSRKKARSSSAG